MAALAAILLPATASAVEGEIHVYDDSLAGPGTLGLTVNNNYVARGPAAAPYPGAVAPAQSLTGGTEFAYGVSRGIEFGLYVPIVSVERGGHVRLDGAELRLLLVPSAETGPGASRIFYGVNLALGINNRALSDRSLSGEVQPILGGRWRNITLALNPNLETGFDGTDNIRFSPSERLAVDVAPDWVLALEHYSDWGTVAHATPLGAIEHQAFGVVQHTVGASTIEAGVGWGLSRDSDRLTVKLVLSFELF